VDVGIGVGFGVLAVSGTYGAYAAGVGGLGLLAYSPPKNGREWLGLAGGLACGVGAFRGLAPRQPKTINGNSLKSTKAQHGYEIVDTTTGKVVKTGVSGGKRTANGGSYRANRQANKWNKEAGTPGRYQPRVVQEVPEGPGAREAILEWEAENAQRLRDAGELNDPTKHSRP
jgi:hypothetical protein